MSVLLTPWFDVILLVLLSLVQQNLDVIHKEACHLEAKTGPKETAIQRFVLALLAHWRFCTFSPIRGAVS